MRWAVILLVLAPAFGHADEIEGKWGLGVDSGLFRSGGVHGALIFGRSAGHAWSLDVRAEENVTDVNGSAPGIGARSNGYQQFVGIAIGPRFRRFTRPHATWTPYWDVFAQVTHATRRYSSDSSTSDVFSTGGVLGAGFGIEYFTPWHFSVSAHSDLLNASYARVRERDNNPFGASSGSGYQQSVNAVVVPSLELRAYF